MKIEEIEALAERIDSLESELVCERGEYRDGWKNAFQTVRYELEDLMAAARPIRHNANVDMPDTAAQDSASKSNNPAVSG